jgi:hypothetical protein
LERIMHKYNNRWRIVVVFSVAALLAATTPAAAGIGLGGLGAFFGSLHARAPGPDSQARVMAKVSPVTVHPLPPVANQRDASRDESRDAAPIKIDYQPGGLISDDMGKLGAKASP